MAIEVTTEMIVAAYEVLEGHPHRTYICSGDEKIRKALEAALRVYDRQQRFARARLAGLPSGGGLAVVPSR